jgi:halocyanin-like protein
MSNTEPRGTAVTRRSVIRTGLVAGAGVAGLGGATTAAAQSDYDGWLSDVSNYDGTTVDRTGQDEVTVRVGTQANGGAFGFGPPAVRVSPGTTVVWQWTGEGNQHNVVDEAGAFESDLASEAGYTFEHTFESEGTFKYYCQPHETVGMKGVVVVGEAPGGGNIGYGGWLSDVSNYDGTTEDRTGQEETTVQVGTQANGGAFGFGPPAIHVDPGTTVVWEWTGEGNQHNVVDEAGAFESDLSSEAGYTFEYTFEETGIYKYYCAPHEALGMKGAVAVGDVGRGEATPTPTPDEGAGFEWTFENFFVGAFFGVVGLTALGVLGAEGLGGYREFRESQPEAGVYASEAAATSPETAVGHDEYDPWGTATLVAVYFAILVLMWLFMYFVEFLGRGPTVIG